MTMKMFHTTSKVYEDVSYDVEGLFTSIPVKETIDYIIQKIYVKKEITILQKLYFYKITKGTYSKCVFSINNRLIKQVNVWPKGGPISSFF